MNVKSSAHYQRKFRERLREQGLVKKEVWIRPEHAQHLAAVEKSLRGAVGPYVTEGVLMMTDKVTRWTTPDLLEALAETELIKSGQATVELIDGVDPALHIVMGEHGDLPIFLTVSGEQIIVESVLWPASDVADVGAFNDAILRTHKYFPLSTISLDKLGGRGDYYHMFGSLSAASIIQNVVFEIEILASNVIQATEAYGDYLSVSLTAS